MGRRECKDRQAAGPATDLGCGARLLPPIGSCCSTRTLCLCRQACVWICVVRRLLLLVFVVVLSSPALPGFAATGPEARVSDLQKNKDKRGGKSKKMEKMAKMAKMTGERGRGAQLPEMWARVDRRSEASGRRKGHGEEPEGEA